MEKATEILHKIKKAREVDLYEIWDEHGVSLLPSARKKEIFKILFEELVEADILPN